MFKNTCMHHSPTVDKVWANMETMLNDHHLQALSLKGVMLLTSTYFFYKICIEDGSENDKATVRNISCSSLLGV